MKNKTNKNNVFESIRNNNCVTFPVRIIQAVNMNNFFKASLSATDSRGLN